MIDRLLKLANGDSYGLRPDRILTPLGPISDTPLLLVDRGQISSCGPEGETPRRLDARDVLRLPGMTIVPGVVDTHNHVATPFPKAMTFGEPAQLWKRVWFPVQAAATDETCYLGSKWTFLEALRGGFTTIVDAATRPSSQTAAVLRAASETGIRLVVSTGVDDAQDFESGSPSPGMARSLAGVSELAEEHVALCAAVPQVTPSMAGGNVESGTPAMIEAVAGWCADHDVLFQIHANEHTAEVHNCVERHGCRPIELLYRLQALGPHVLIAHAALATRRELARVAETDTALSYNPVASQWKGNAAADALAWRELGIRFGLGTDVTRNDAFRLLDAADATHRIAHSMAIDDFAGGTGTVWWKAATIGGARAAGLTDVGELRPGACADYLVLDSSTPETMPSWDLEWELARFYDKSNVKAVVVGGKPRVLEGRPVGWELDEFLDEALEVGLAQLARARPRTIRQGDWSAIMLPESVDD